MEAHDVGEAARLERELERARVRVFVKEWRAFKRKSNRELRYASGVKRTGDSDEDESNQCKNDTAIAISSMNSNLWELAEEYVKGAGSFHGRYLRHRRQIIRRFQVTNPEDEQLVSKKAFKDRNIQLYSQSRFVECSLAGLSPLQTVYQIKGELAVGYWKDEDFYWSSEGDSTASTSSAAETPSSSPVITSSSTEWAESSLAEKPRSLSPLFTRSQSDSQVIVKSPKEWIEGSLVDDLHFAPLLSTSSRISSPSPVTRLSVQSEKLSDTSRSTVRNEGLITTSSPQGSVLYQLATTGCGIIVILLAFYLSYTIVVICLRIPLLAKEEGLQR